MKLDGEISLIMRDSDSQEINMESSEISEFANQTPSINKLHNVYMGGNVYLHIRSSRTGQ